MANPEKALLKAAIAEELATELMQAIVNAEKNGIATAASRDTVERLFARVAGYKKKIDVAFEDGTFKEPARDPVYAVFRDITLLIQEAHTSLVKVAAEQAPFASGLRKAHSMALERAAREKTLAARAIELEKEEAAAMAPSVGPPTDSSPPAEPPAASIPVEVSSASDSPQGVQAPVDESPPQDWEIPTVPVAKPKPKKGGRARNP